MDPLKRNANLVESLGSALREGGHALGTVPDLLKRVLAEESWREFVTQRGEHVVHERFADFVATRPLKGIGANVELVERIVADDPEATRALRAALIEKPGSKSGDVITRSRKTGTSKAYALDRLSRDAPELHADVLAGRLSAHGAMVSAGFRPKTATVRVDSPERVADALRRLMGPEELARLIALLLGADRPS